MVVGRARRRAPIWRDLWRDLSLDLAFWQPPLLAVGWGIGVYVCVCDVFLCRFRADYTFAFEPIVLLLPEKIQESHKFTWVSSGSRAPVRACVFASSPSYPTSAPGEGRRLVEAGSVRRFVLCNRAPRKIDQIARRAGNMGQILLTGHCPRALRIE